MKNKLLKQTISVIIGISLLSFSAISTAQLSWNAWVQQLRQEAVAQGISPTLFDNLFANISEPDKKTLHFDRKQPEKRLTYLQYRNTRGDAYRIKLGQQKYKKYQNILEEVGSTYGVDPCVITALWGIETSYSHFMGDFPVIKSLATLAYDDRRSAFFRKELLLALKILNEGHISPEKFKGEWAGASGMPQFLPSSWYQYAVDYDGDGRKDIWTSYSDAFASIANYLKQNGWQQGESWGLEVNADYGIDEKLVDSKTKMSLQQWYNLGLKPLTQTHLSPDTMAELIHPYGGPYLLITNNFRTLLHYNNSIFYAGTVSYIADKICYRR